MPIRGPKATKYELAEALSSAAANVYLIASQRGVPGVTPQEALEAVLEMRTTGPFGDSNLLESFRSDKEGQEIVEQMAQMVIQKVAKIAVR